MTTLIELQQKQVALNTIKKLIERLELRLILIGQNNSTKTMYEKNESEIIKIDTILRIHKLNERKESMQTDFLHTYGKHIRA